MPYLTSALRSVRILPSCRQTKDLSLAEPGAQPPHRIKSQACLDAGRPAAEQTRAPARNGTLDALPKWWPQ